jgi:hypothetical protein
MQGTNYYSPQMVTYIPTVAQGIEQQPSKLWAARSIRAGRANYRSSNERLNFKSSQREVRC